MQLNELHIQNFGQLKNRTFTFEPGLSIITGENEQGKSTLLNCIKAMFFGLSGTRRSIRENERQRFWPWDGGPLAANLVFTHEGVRYRLERSFGKTKASDQCSLMTDITGQVVPLPGQQEVGQFMFGVTADEFANTVFIGQLQSPLTGPDDSMLSKLGNLSGSLDEGLSYAALDQKLREAQTRLKLEKGVGGLIPELHQNITALETARSQAITLESQQLVQLSHLNMLRQQVQVGEGRLSRLKAQLAQAVALERIQLFERLQKRQSDLQTLRQDLERDEAQLRFKGVLLRAEDVTQMRTRLAQVRACLADIAVQQQVVQRATADQDMAQAVVRSFQRLAGLDRLTVEQHNSRLAAVQTQIRLEQDARRYRVAVTARNQAQDQLAEREAELRQQSDKLSDLMAESSRAATTAGPSTQASSGETGQIRPRLSNKSRVGILFALCLIILGVLSGVLVDPLFLIVALGGGLVALIIWITAQQTARAAAEKTRIATELQRREDDLARQQAAAALTQAIALQASKVESAAVLLAESQNALKSAENQLALVIPELVPDALAHPASETAWPELMAEATRLQARQQAWLEQSGSASLTDLLVRLQQAEQAQQTLAYSQDQLAKAIEKLTQLHNVAAAAETALREALQPDVGPVELPTIAALEQQLEDLAAKILHAQSLRDQIRQLNQAMDEALGGQDWSDFALEIEHQIRLRDKVSAAGSEPEPDTELGPLSRTDLETLISSESETLASLRIEEGRIDSAIRHSPGLPYLAVEYDRQIAEARQQLAEAVAYYDALSLARKHFTAAYEDLQATFGPVLNDKAAAILHQLTGGKYKDLKIDRSFKIKIETPTDGRFHEWDYFSGGTIDQVYLALRLAVSELITTPSLRLPLLLDDVFVQYDDERTFAGIRFLHEKVAAEQSQALLLTSHNRIAEMARSISPAISVQSFT